MVRRWVSLSLLLPALVAGCAPTGKLVGPGDFSLHLTDHSFVDVHWRLEREPKVVYAVGLVEATRQGGIAEVTLELKGLDRDGHVVSRALGHTFGRPLMRWDTLPFTVRLRPTGREDRFELRVWGYTWDTGAGNNTMK